MKIMKHMKVLGWGFARAASVGSSPRNFMLFMSFMVQFVVLLMRELL